MLARIGRVTVGETIVRVGEVRVRGGVAPIPAGREVDKSEDGPRHGQTPRIRPRVARVHPCTARLRECRSVWPLSIHRRNDRV